MATSKLLGKVGDVARNPGGITQTSSRAADGSVLLGIEDEVVPDAYASTVDFTTSFIGGRPVWITDLPSWKETLCCQLCRRPTVHVLQIYAPLEGSPYDRTLNVFVCLNASCWKTSRGWNCVRTQKLSESTFANAAGIPEKADDWLDDACDWGDDPTNEGEASGLTTVMENLAVNTPEDFANCNVAGATGISHATAEIERGSDRDNSPDAPIQIEDLALPSKNHLATVPALLLGVDPKTGADIATPVLGNVTFVQKYISVVEEPKHGKDQGIAYNDLDWRSKLDETTSTDDSVYEKAAPAHGDKWFWKFSRRLSLMPSQIVRYNRGSDDRNVLWMKPPQREALNRCRHCGAVRRFEFQILPTFFNSLSLEAEWIAPDFGNLVVYTCSRSCWEQNDAFKTEFCVYQPELE